MSLTVAGHSGLLGFDTNQVVDAMMARAFRRHGFVFACRYVPRMVHRITDLTDWEVKNLHNAGLAVMAVQHVESENAWVPNADKGSRYGQTAAQCAEDVGLSKGSNVWCDLEGVARGVPSSETYSYCKIWYGQVASFGYTPGLYVGWHCGLSSRELYRLPFEHYWGSYNLNSDEEPIVRGLQMKQMVAKKTDVPAAVKCDIDVNLIKADRLGGLPLLCVPDIWDPSPIRTV